MPAHLTGFVAVEIPFTPRAKRVLELALEEARQLGHSYIGTEHLLLGLLREGEGVAARVLENLDADPAKIRSQVSRLPTILRGPRVKAAAAEPVLLPPRPLPAASLLVRAESAGLRGPGGVSSAVLRG